jgi:tRNA G37 N-methylase TrmD
MSEPFVILRNTESRQSHSFTPEDADKWLNHPVFGQHLEVVRTDKPEVLGKSASAKKDTK